MIQYIGSPAPKDGQSSLGLGSYKGVNFHKWGIGYSYIHMLSYTHKHTYIYKILVWLMYHMYLFELLHHIILSTRHED